jgi:hypothetical protein
MNTKNLQQKIKNIGLVLSLVFSFVLLSSLNVKAQYRDPNYYPQNRRNDDHHKNKHKHDKHGNGNYNRGNRDDDRDDDYDNDDRDDNNGRYNRSRNNNDGGYYDRNGNYHPNNNGGYNRNGGYGNGGYNNSFYRIAQQNGYNDGLRKGAEDARERHNNPQGTSEYKRATNGYDSSYRDKEGYKQAYRQAFLQGFDEGQNRYYNNGRYGNRNRSNNGAGSIFRRIITGY